MVKVSVIIPVYSVAKYIEKCTESLLAQTLQEMEFIFVDDHGLDNSIELVHHVIAGHPRKSQFRFLDSGKNLGAGMARNYAIPYAEGEYVAFVDGDDWVEPEMFASLYKQALANGGTDICYSHILKDYPNGKTKVLKNPIVKSGVFTHEKKAFFLVNYSSQFTTYIYKKSFLLRNGVRFPGSPWAEDSYFVSCSLLTAQSVACVDKPLYHYLVRVGSASTSKDGQKHLKRISVFDNLILFAKEHRVYEEFKEEVDFVYVKKCGLMAMVDYIKDSTAPKSSVYKEVFQLIQQRVPDYKSNKYYKKNGRVGLLLWMSQHFPKAFTKVVHSFF